MRILVLAVCLWSCGGGDDAGTLQRVSPPDDLQQASTTVLSGSVAGSSPSDFWFLEERASPLENRLWHYDGAEWSVKATPFPLARFASLAASSAGSVWVQTGRASNMPGILQVSADGTVVDRSADIPVLSNTHRFLTAKGSVYFEVTPSSSGAPQLFKLANDHFTHLIDLPVNSSVGAIFSDDEIWLDAAEGTQSVRVSKRLQGGTWVAFDAPQTLQPTYSSPTDVWILKSAMVGTDGTFSRGSGTTLVHYDGTAFTEVVIPEFGPAVGRWGVVSVAPGVIAVLSTPISNASDPAASYTNLESRRWDGSKVSGATTLIGHASDCGTSQSHCDILRIHARATLLDGTLVHTHAKVVINSTVELEPYFYFGSASDY